MQPGNRSLVTTMSAFHAARAGACKSTLVARSPLVASLPWILFLLDLLDLTTSDYL
jgi:hypothetical protein